ncbi:T9SS type A sorting domain-containing protein [Bacteroidales bacterium AH-315-N07]|nr:T9SS type A sorting domain-containing protein [Bacteroidales bacterium AH-315-N07]
MRKILRLLLIAAILSGTTFIGFAQQTYVKQVIVVNGGKWESTAPFTDYVTVSKYDPVLKSYSVFDTIKTQSTQSVLIDSNYAYVAAADSLVMYNLNTYSRIAAKGLPGVKKMAVYDSSLIVTRGFGASNNYVVVYNRYTLDSVTAFTSISDQCNDIIVEGDTAYVAVPGAWNATVGKLAVINLKDMAFVRELNLDTLGKGIESLFADGSKIYTVNSIGWGMNGMLGHYNIATAVMDTFVELGTPASKGIYYRGTPNYLYADFGNGLGIYNTGTMQIEDTSLISTSFASGVTDTKNELFYLTTTDYSTYGKFFIYDFSGNLVDSMDVGISPEAIAVDYRVNNAPVAANDNVTTKENTAVVIDVKSNDNDPDTDNLTTSIVSNPPNGTANLLNADSIQYTPNNSFTGKDSLVYKICDVQGLCDTANVVITVNPSTSVTDNSIENRFSIYPNPAKDILNVLSSEKFTDLNIAITDITGRTIFRKTNLLDKNDFTINISDLLDGVYLITFSNEDYSVTKKIIKN